MANAKTAREAAQAAEEYERKQDREYNRQIVAEVYDRRRGEQIANNKRTS